MSFLPVKSETVTGSRPAWSIEVTPITMTMVNWPTFKEKFPESIRKIDDHKLSLESLATYMIALGYTDWAPSLHPMVFVRSGISAALHDAVSFGFCIETNYPDLLREFICVAAIPGIGKLDKMVFTATLRAWKSAVVACSQKRQTTWMRCIGNRIFEYLMQAGFKEIFYEFTRNALSDGTFELCPR